MQPKRTYPRIERDEIVEIHEDENAHLWAVSYSDFLMALLSFFILFYSVDDKQRDQLIMNITAELAKDSTLTGGAGSGTGFGAGNGPGLGGGVIDEASESPSELSKSFIAALKGLDFKVVEENQFIIINFPDDIFPKGGWKMREDRSKQLEHFLAIARPYDGQFNLYFEGHTDDQPLIHHRNKVVTDNFVLSSLRASTALQMAKSAGFNEKYLFTQANSSNVRNSRSLSIRLERRKEKS